MGSNCSGWKNTVEGGAGNDTIKINIIANPKNSILPGNYFKYAEGDGNDVVIGYTTNTTLALSGNPSYDSVVSDNDVIIKVGSGFINLISSVNKYPLHSL